MTADQIKQIAKIYLPIVLGLTLITGILGLALSDPFVLEFDLADEELRYKHGINLFALLFIFFIFSITNAVSAIRPGKRGLTYSFVFLVISITNIISFIGVCFYFTSIHPADIQDVRLFEKFLMAHFGTAILCIIAVSNFKRRK